MDRKVSHFESMSTDPSSLPTARVGVIGGSGLYSIEGLETVEEVTLDTPFGPLLIVSELDNSMVLMWSFLPVMDVHITYFQVKCPIGQTYGP